MRTGEIGIQAKLHSSGLWITVPLEVVGFGELTMVFDSGSPMSAISPEIRARLGGRGVVGETAKPSTYRLTGLTAEGQSLPDLDVRVMPRLTRLQINGLIGLNYLGIFESICFDVPTLRLTLKLR